GVGVNDQFRRHVPLQVLSCRSPTCACRPRTGRIRTRGRQTRDVESGSGLVRRNRGVRDEGTGVLVDGELFADGGEGTLWASLSFADLAAHPDRCGSVLVIE